MIPPPPEPMTIEQLKKHMDRRFDRLERTKADRSDLRRFATKNDFGRLEDRIVTVQRILEGIVRHQGIVLDDHEARIRDLERRS